ncbi:hypothetical protein B0T10DRAFT_18464 [Thelonectria olida]|uniref:FAD-binding FR-type domain-containing protein n=1 Tax=Thelonectria olida TaxID=1576542 RepID=A0A9P8WGB3_9HYPO|nr:hypothetical protein B0T10DRAFT_18464 [Thelonectria olida]
MLGWPYEFVTLTEDEKVHRRHAIEHNASVAFWSAFAPAVTALLLRVVARVYRRWRSGQYREVPGSPALKAQRQGWAVRVAERWRRMAWWMGEDVCFAGAHWGHREEWVVGLGWTLWLLFLCVRGTGKDYLHLTKRFGAIATSQLPIQYFLALKYLSPFGYFFRTSHEDLNRWHRALGRIIYLLLVLHAVFYNVFFIMSSIWLKRFFAPVVFAGVVAFACLHTLNGTSMAKMREQSYRVFFVVHLVTAMVVPPLIFFHAPSMRIYVSLAIGFLLLDLAVRKMTTIQAPSVVESIPGTDLLKITSKMPANKIIKFKARPGAHLYLSLPPSSRPVPNDPYAKGNFLFEFMYNPFTVVSADEDSGHLTFVARKRTGPMTTRLAEFVGAGIPEDPETQIPLCIEGPYGALSKTFSDLVDTGVSRILLVAGGVGATFAVPIYHALLAESPAASIQFVWAIRSPGDATWVPPKPAGKSLIDDDQVQLFLTGDMGVSHPRNETIASVEMSNLRRSPVGQNHKRPNFQKLVDDTFKSGADETVAVLVCGPVEMGRELRRCITPWVMKGRSVWWHNESFGW